MKLPKLLRAASSKKSKKGKGIEIETVPKTEPGTLGHYFEEKNNLNLPPPALPDNVTESSLAPSVPQETSSSPIFNDSPSVTDLFPLDLKIKASLPTISERHSSSSSSSDYGVSYRSHSSSGPSVSRGSNLSFPYPLLYESLDLKLSETLSYKTQPLGTSTS